MMKDNEIYLRLFGHGYGLNRMRWMSIKRRRSATSFMLFIIFFIIICAFFIFLRWIDINIISGVSLLKPNFSDIKTTKSQEFPLRCAKPNQTQTCPSDYPTSQNPTNPSRPSNLTCPSYFRWIYEDLKPWRETGITKDMVDRAGKTAHFRLVIINGKAYVEKHRQAIQTRDKFTLWGILQLLRRCPGRLPDLELMFDCNDRPVVRSRDFGGPKPSPPPLFRYCSDQMSLDIVFPDWSFWGWAEINIRPWEELLKDIKKGNKRIKWEDRAPYAYWKGNPHVSPIRKDLMKCNVTKENDWSARLFKQDWVVESKKGYKKSKLEYQCSYRYKIYIDGWAWSVSEKYILACDSMTLFVRSPFHDFFNRGMVPLQHYWPIRDSTKCTSLKFAVEWGNNHTDKAIAIGKTASNFIQEELKMDYVYDYMFHLLNEYSKLLRFKPTVPPGAIEVCPETIACVEKGIWREFMEESMVKSPSDSIPCTMPRPLDPSALQNFLEKKANLTRKVEIWENGYWSNLRKKQQ